MYYVYVLQGEEPARCGAVAKALHLLGISHELSRYVAAKAALTAALRALVGGSASVCVYALAGARMHLCSCI